MVIEIWSAVLAYLATAMATFRTRFLKYQEDSERKADKADKCGLCDKEFFSHSHADHYEGNGFGAGLAALFWPAYWAALLAWKAMFPTGTKTRYTKQKEQEARLKKDLADLKKAAADLGLKLPEGFDATT